jgi:hypothetical protein
MAMSRTTCAALLLVVLLAGGAAARQQPRNNDDDDKYAFDRMSPDDIAGSARMTPRCYPPGRRCARVGIACSAWPSRLAACNTHTI